VDPDAKPEAELALAHKRALAKIPKRTRLRYRDTVELVEKLCDGHARAVVEAEKRGEDPPELDAELVSAIAQYSTTGRLE
jgi:predicted site-specific integrase-resolvase